MPLPALQNFVDQVGPPISAAWLNAVDKLMFTIFGQAATNAAARTALMSDAPLEITNGGTGSRVGWWTTSGAGSTWITFIGTLFPIIWQFINPQTPAELALSVTPTNYIWPEGVVDRYGTNTTPGTTNMTAPSNTAISVIKQKGAGAIVYLDGFDYFVVPTASGPTGLTACTLSAMSNVTIRGRARIVSNTSVISIPVIFLLQDCNQVTVDGLRFYDTGANISVDFQGPWAIYATTTTANDCGAIHVKDVETQNILGPFAAVLWTGTGRVRGIHFTNLKADACYYGTPSLQENGDAVTGSVIVNNCRRAGFPYGISGVNMTYDIWHDAVAVGANATLDIKRYTRDTSGIKIRASFHGSPVKFGSIVNFETQANLATLGLTGLGAVTGGSGYTTGWYANVPVTGSISGATNATLALNFVAGVLVSAFICNPGNGYLATDILTFSNAQVGGAGTGASIAASAVGGTIKDVDIDLDLSGCTFPNPTITGTTPFPVQIRSLTPGGVLNTTTTDVFDGITIRGNLGDWSFAQPGQTPQAINVLSKQLGTPGRLHLGGDFFGNFGGDPQVYPGFVVRTAIDTDVYTELGDLTATPVFIDLSKYDGHGFALKVLVHAESDTHSGGNATNAEYPVTGFKIAGSTPTLSPATPAAIWTSNLGTASTIAFAASGNGVNVSFTSYNGARAYLKMAVQHLQRFSGSA